jgi:hypothetical protein
LDSVGLVSRIALELVPPAPDSEAQAVAEAIARTEPRLAQPPAPGAYASAWRVAAIAEGIERAPGESPPGSD